MVDGDKAATGHGAARRRAVTAVQSRFVDTLLEPWLDCIGWGAGGWTR